MSGFYLFAAGVLFALSVVLVLAGARRVTDHERRIAELEKAARPASKHDLRALIQHDLGEGALFKVAPLRQQIEVLQAHERQLTAFLEHLAAGGHPDEPRSQWRTLRKD